jgi:hypothetical protein
MFTYLVLDEINDMLCYVMNVQRFKQKGLHVVGSGVSLTNGEGTGDDPCRQSCVFYTYLMSFCEDDILYMYLHLNYILIFFGSKLHKLLSGTYYLIC